MVLMVSRLLFVIFLSTVLAKLTFGQVEVTGRYEFIASTPEIVKSLLKGRVHNLPLQNNVALLAEAEAEDRPFEPSISQKDILEDFADDEDLDVIAYPDDVVPKSGPYKFGQQVPLDIKMSDNPADGEWIVDEQNGVRIWRFSVRSVGALSLSLYFTDFYLASDAELYIIGAVERRGAFTAQENNKSSRKFAIAPISGDFLTLEYIEPIELPLGSSSLALSHAVHAFRPNPFSAAVVKAAGSCNINVACPEGADKQDQAKAVGLFIGMNGQGFCTGTMLNNVLRDGRQLFLTANHCIENEEDDLDNLLVGFNYQYKKCSDWFEFRPKPKTVHGLKLLSAHKASDFAILEVIEKIPDSFGVMLAGWNATTTLSTTESFYGLHHPSGDVKKVSLYDGMAQVVRVSGFGPTFWRVLKWTKGVTEKGSSGSGLFNSKNQLIGYLMGGDSSCRRPEESDYYGSLGKDWHLGLVPLKEILDPDYTGIIVTEAESLTDVRMESAQKDTIDSGSFDFDLGKKSDHKT